MKKISFQKQRGISLWGVMGLVVAAVVVLWLAIKVAPEYLESSSVDTCLKDAYAASNFASNNRVDDLKTSFNQCLQNNAIYEQSGYEIKPQGKTAILEWKRQLPMFGNASLLLEFSARAPE
ncbi:MAG: DUF4845 domain-containing protein [Burkholderiales bacterium]|jgi:hypothetical protein|nr:DUF4845 domain-containing protein [Burkholderiales bacterium]